MSDPRIEENQIKVLLEAWAKATRQNRQDKILEIHKSDLVIFDVLPPLKYESAASLVRATFCLEKIGGLWWVSHQHVSKPFQLSNH